MSEPKIPQKWKWSVPCDQCQHLLPPLREIAPDYFFRGSVKCPSCGHAVDLFHEVVRRMDVHLGGTTLQALGARATYFRFDLAAQENKEVDFAEYGVHSDATILSVNYTPIGHCFPVELHGNEARRRWPGTKVRVLGYPLGDAKDPRAQVQVFVTWIHEESDPEAWLMLADAFEAAVSEKYVRMIPPAQSAYEIVSTRLVSAAIGRVVSKGLQKKYVENELTSFSVTNIWLPLLCSRANLSFLPEPVRGRLNQLRRLRNKILHEGHTENALDEREARELLAAAVFGFEFVRYASDALLAG